MIPEKMRALRCRNCGTDWRGGACQLCGFDRFIDFVPFLPEGRIRPLEGDTASSADPAFG